MSVSLVIFGSRTWHPSIAEIDLELLACFRMDASGLSEVVCGMARGADQAGQEWAHYRGVPVVEMPADWTKHGKAAGPLRNRAMADRATIGLGFWDGKSHGTVHMAGLLACLEKRVMVIRMRPQAPVTTQER